MLQNTGKFAGKTIVISGASRGIGKAIALKLAKDKANIVVAAKTAEAHPKLPGTIYTVAKEIEAAGGRALPCIVDVRDEKSVIEAVEKAVKEFGGIDILINNASAISLTKTVDTDMKRYDLMHQINGRGTFLMSKVCIPYLKSGQNPHILNMSPPINLNQRWFANHLAYTMSKYNMSMVALGLSEELKGDGIAANALWPKTAIHTAAMEMLGGKDVASQCRVPEIMADAAYAILSRESHKYTGNFVIDEDILREEGVTDFAQYSCDKNTTDFIPDFYLDETLNGSVHASQYTIAGARGSAPAPAASQAGSGASSQQASSASGGLADIFGKLGSKVNAEVVNNTKAVFQFDCKEGAKYYLDLKNGDGASGSGESPFKPDVTLTANEESFLKIFTGALNPTTAFMNGKLKIKGDIAKAMKLSNLLGKAKSKL